MSSSSSPDRTQSSAAPAGPAHVLVDRSQFDTAVLPAEQRFAAWQSAVAEIYDIALPDGADPMTFNVKLDSCLLDDVQINHGVMSGVVTSRDQARIAADGLDHYQLVVYRRGEARVRAGTREVLAATGSFIAVGLDEDFHSVTTDHEILNLMIPRRRLAPRLDDPDQAHGIVFDARTGGGRLLADYIAALHASASGLSKRQAPQAVEALLTLAAMALNGAEFERRDPPSEADHALLIRAQTHIREHLAEPDLSPEGVASALGLSRARLYRLFTAHGGVGEYIRELRLRRAFADLISPRNAGLQIAQIAYACGFNDPSYFARRFKARFDVAPGDVRDQQAEAATHYLAAEDRPEGDTRYAFWVSNLG